MRYSTYNMSYDVSYDVQLGRFISYLFLENVNLARV